MAFDIRYAGLAGNDYERLIAEYPKLDGVGHYEFCPTCSKTGTYLWKGIVYECDCETQFALYKHYLAAGVGVPYQRLSWTDWEGDPEVCQAVQTYVNTPGYIKRGKGLFFWGEFGRGKTMLGMLVIKELVKRGMSCYATTYPDTVKAFTAGWDDVEDKRWFERKFKTSDVLLLDDLGKEHWGKSSLPQTTFDNLIRARVQAGRPTLITTNMEPSTIRAAYGPSAMSLINEQSIPFEFSEGENFHEKVEARDRLEIINGEDRPIV